MARQLKVQFEESATLIDREAFGSRYTEALAGKEKSYGAKDRERMENDRLY